MNFNLAASCFNVTSVRKATPPQASPGALVFLRTAEGANALARMDNDGKIISESPRAILELAACAPDNRLMFVYFVQHKGFLNDDRDYLRTRLNLMRQVQGKDKFHSFYRYFLIKLFHEGLGGKKRTTELEKLIGRIPYLNGGMFDVHELEKKYDTAIEIPDAAWHDSMRAGECDCAEYGVAEIAGTRDRSFRGA